MKTRFILALLLSLAAACSNEEASPGDLSSPVCTGVPFTVESAPIVESADGGTVDCMSYCATGFISDDFGVKGGARPQVRSCAVLDHSTYRTVSCTFSGC